MWTKKMTAQLQLLYQYFPELADDNHDDSSAIINCFGVSAWTRKIQKVS